MIINYIISTWGDSHQINRALILEQNGIKAIKIAFIREYYPSKIKSPDVVLGILVNAKYGNRAIQYLKAFGKLRKVLKSNTHPIYVFGSDNIIMIWLLLKFLRLEREVYYEVPDIRGFQIRENYLSHCFISFYKRALKIVTCFIFTSPEFESEYFEKHIGFRIKKSIVLENKVHDSLFPSKSKIGVVKPFESANEESIIIGYFGLIRCIRSLQILLRLVEENKRYFLIIRGIYVGIPDVLQSRIESNDKIKFCGPYMSPEDLESIYSEIDLSWISYPHSTKKLGNWCWARTNRFYEAGYFNTPMIASLGTVDGERVRALNIGIAVLMDSPSEAINQILNLDRNKIEKFYTTLESLDNSHFKVGDDYKNLIETLLDDNLKVSQKN